MRYGALPEDLGPIKLSPAEMMFWLYCPILTPTSADAIVPSNLKQFWPILDAVMALEHQARGKYVYLTAKTLWVGGDHIGNRPGWHSDGFGTNDVNYIWYDRAPTEFLRGAFSLADDCDDAMAQMAVEATRATVTYFPNKHLLRLTPACVHRSPVHFEEGMRTFVKVSISPDRYNLEGNSINHGLAERWPLVPREVVRNHPVRADFVKADQTRLGPLNAGESSRAANK